MNAEPRQNVRGWLLCGALLTLGAQPVRGEPLAVPSAQQKEAEVSAVSDCRLKTVPDQPAQRDRHTCLLANFDATDSNDAVYARVEPREVGIGNTPGAPGRFGGGVAVTANEGCVMYPGLDNYHPQQGTVEFWAQASDNQPVWSDGKEHWFLVLYPERAGKAPQHGMAPYFVTLRKTTGNQLELQLTTAQVPSYAAATTLRAAASASVTLDVQSLDPQSWHHIVCSWDLTGPGQLWLLIDGQGSTRTLELAPDHAAPNPGGLIVFGGFWGLPGDGVATSHCNLDDLRIQARSVASLLATAPAAALEEIDESRLLAEEDAARAMLDQLLKLQFHGGWQASYHWPTYTPTGWGQIGRGVDMWFAHSAEAAQSLFRGWLIWGDDRYLDGAIEAADMFCQTQLENGSWAYHYSYTRGEFQRWGDYAYIAQAMQSNQIRLLCLLSRRLGYPRYEQAIRRAGDWMVSIQHASGAWGWEAYPIGTTGPYGHPALNDAVTPQAMHDLFVIWCATGDEKYLAPILRGADWIVAAQAGPPTYGWADQYNDRNEFIWMRGFEPPAVSMQAISSATWGLCLAYDLTGNDKYLEPLRRILQWMEAVPEDARGWLWYDPATNVPVVAYNNEMLPVTHPKAISEMIPRLDAHYGTRFPWQANRIRDELRQREQGPVYLDWRGWRPLRAFAQGPALTEFAAYFRANVARDALSQIAAWQSGQPLSGGLLGGSAAYGRTFEIGNAIRYCEQLLTDIEMGRVATGDIAPERVPRYARNGNLNWVYLDPQRNFLETLLRSAQN